MSTKSVITSSVAAKPVPGLWSLLWLASALCMGATFVGACGDDSHDGQTADGGVAGGAGRAAAGSGGGSAGRKATGTAQLGAACKTDADCAGGYVCDVEIKQTEKVPGAPSGSVDNVVFSGGSCTPIKLATYDQTGSGRSCDPTQPRGSQGCGSDGQCAVVREVQSNASVPAVACRVSCEPSAAESGCDREGYACDLVEGVCEDGCHSDTECRISALDTDGDGQADQLEYDGSSPNHCDLKTARCRHPAGASASGEPCADDTECAEDGQCLPASSPVAGQTFPGGLCTRIGCQYPGFECDKGTVCESLRPWLDESPSIPLCFQHCTVGAEKEDFRLGKSGHGEGCRDGYRCHYNGGPGTDGGVCVGGNYNDVKTNNIGSQCKTDAECYSPFGMGACLFYSTSSTQQLPGICTIFDCAAPGMPADLCGSRNECVSVGSSDGTSCMHHCSSADECPQGFACTDDDGEPGTPSNCIPACLTNADCRSKEQCVRRTAMAQSGLCMLQ